MYKKEHLYNCAKQLLTEKRFMHTKGVVDTAIILANRFGADAEKAEIAALLHDITKKLNDDEQIDLAKKLEIDLSDSTLSAKKTLHAFTAGGYAKKVLNITDTEITDAITYHTTLRKNMTLMDKIVYIADFIEPGRDFEGVKKARELINKSLDDTCIYCLKFTINEVLERGIYIHTDTVEAYNQLVSERKNNGN